MRSEPGSCYDGEPGPGFDVGGMALDLYNEITVTESMSPQ